MLQNIHDKAKGWVAYLIVGFIAIPFTLFGISSYLGGSDSLVAAVVNGEEIPVQEVQNSVVQQRQRLMQMFGGKLPPNFSDDSIKEQALEQIINRTLLRQESENNGYRVSNQEVFDTIAEIPAFQVNGTFDAKTYEKLLAAQRRSKSEFEATIRTSLSDQQFSQALSKAAFVPPAEISRYQALQNQTRDIETYTLKKDDFRAGVTVSDDEIKTYYDKNLNRFMSAEKVKISYIELNQSALADSVEVSDDSLQAFYDENAGRYIDPEQRKLSHILVKIDAEKDGADAEKKAQERAQSLYAQIKDGSKTFEDLATSSSDDKFSAKKAGDIGFIIKGDMGRLFETAAFALEKGKVSEPVKAEAGFEIIKLVDIKAEQQKSYADVKDKVEKGFRAEKAEKLFLDSSDKIQTLAFENESSLDEAADAAGVKVKTSDWIIKGTTPTSKDLSASPKVIAAAFSDEVLDKGKNSELLEVDSETVAVIRIQEHEAPKQKPMADVTDSIKTILSDQKVRKVLIEKGEAALAILKEKSDWAAAVALFDGSVDKLEKVAGVTRTDTKLSPAVRGKVFSMQKPADGKVSFDNAVLPQGDYALIGLSAVKDGSAEKDKTLLSQFTQMVGSREQTAMLKALREKAEVETFLKNIQ